MGSARSFEGLGARKSFRSKGCFTPRLKSSKPYRGKATPYTHPLQNAPRLCEKSSDRMVLRRS